MKRLRRRSMPAWLAMWALVLQSWWPALSHAMVNVSDSQWVEVCTQTGLAWVRADAANTASTHNTSSSESSSGSATQPCQWCLTHGSLGQGLVSELPAWQLLSLQEISPSGIKPSTAPSKSLWRILARAPPSLV